MRRIVLAVVLVGCAKSSTASVDASFAGQNAKLVYGVASIHPGSGVYVVLSTHKLDCKFPSQLADEKRVSFTIPEGPRGSHLVGSKVGLDVAFSWDSAGAGLTVAPRNVTTVELEPLADRVRGTLKVQWKPKEVPGAFDASGSFDVGICDKQKVLPPPKIASDHPARGTILGAPFEVKDAIAWVGTDRGTRHVSRIQLFPSANVTCGGALLRSTHQPVLSVNVIGGASEVATHLGSPEQAYGMADQHVDHQLKSNQLARTAIRFDKLELTPGALISGALLATNAADAPPGEIEGAFTAHVCEVDPPAVTSKVAMTSTLGDVEASLKYARAEVALDGVHLELTDKPLRCGIGGEFDHRISFFLGTGPERAFFAGGPARHYGMIESRKKATMAVPVTLELQPFKLEEGASVKGSLSFDARMPREVGDKQLVLFSGKGTFETTLCRDGNDGIARLRVHPKSVDATPVAGMVESESFKLGSALVRNGAIELFEHADVTCAKAANDEGPRVTLRVLALAAPPIVGTAQPATVVLHKASETHGGVSQQAFAWLDEVKPERVKGRVFATNSDIDSKTKWQLAGGFDATVCK